MKILTSFCIAALCATMIGTISAANLESNRLLKGDRLTPQEKMDKKAEESVKILEQLQPQSTIHKVVPDDIVAVYLDEPEVILYEDFSLMTAGSEDEIDDTLLPEDYLESGNTFLPGTTYTHEEGWWGAGIFQAGGAVALAYPNFGGYISTPCYNLNGLVQLSFRVRTAPAATKAQSVIVSVLYGDVYNPTIIGNYDMFSVSPDDGWVEETFTYDIDYSGDDIFVQINAALYQTGVIVDDIKIERLGYVLGAPQANDIKDYTGSSFVASWNEQGITDDYLLTVFSSEVPEGENVYGSYDFNSSDLPEGVEINGEIAEVEGEDGLKAIKISGEGSITFDCSGGILDYFNALFYVPDNGENQGNGYATIYGYNEGTWTSHIMTMFTLDTDLENATKVELNNTNGWFFFAGKYTKVRFDFQPYGDTIYLLNAEYEGTQPVEYTYILDNEPVAGTSYTVTDLDPEVDYSYYVYAKYEDYISGISNVVRGYALTTPVTLPATELDERGGFIANWEQVAKAEEYQVVASYATVLTEDNDAYPVFTETFPGAVADGATLDNPVSLDNEYWSESLDAYADNEGWIGVNTIYAENMIGCGQDYSQMAELKSPEMDLSANGGEYTVSFNLYSPYGNMLVVQNSNVDYQYVYASAGMNQVTLDFSAGSQNSYILLYCLYGYPFMVGDFQITQKVTVGTEIKTKLAESEWIEDTEYYFSDIDPYMENLVYTVQARYMRNSKYYYSDWSASQSVYEPDGIAAVEAHTTMIQLNGRIVSMVGAENARINVYNLAGALVATGIGTAQIQAPGAYVVVANGKVEKVMVK